MQYFCWTPWIKAKSLNTACVTIQILMDLTVYAQKHSDHKDKGKNILFQAHPHEQHGHTVGEPAFGTFLQKIYK